MDPQTETGAEKYEVMSSCQHPAANAVIQPQNQTRNQGCNKQATVEIVLHIWLTPLNIRAFHLLFLQILKVHFLYESDSILQETKGLTFLTLQKIPSATSDPAQAPAGTKDRAHPLYVTPSRLP